MSQTIVKTAVPGTPIQVQLPGRGEIQVVDLGNGTPFDLTYVGFGAPSTGGMIIEGGTKVRLFAKVYNPGNMYILPVNNVNVAGTGVINITVYFVSERVPPGTFPIQIPAQIVQATVSNVSTLSNEGGTVGLEVIDIGTAANNKLVDIFNDHFTWSVEQSGTKHTVLQGQSSGNPLLIGQVGDNSEVLGNLIVDGNTTESGTLSVVGITSLDNGLISTDGAGRIVLPNNKAYSAKDTGGTAQHLVYVDLTNGTNLQAAALGGLIFMDDQDGSTIATFAKGGGLQLVSNARIGTSANGDILDATSATATYIKCRNSGVINFQTPNGTTQAFIDSAGIHAASGNAVFFSVGNFTGVSRFTGTGNGTVATGLTNPFSIMCDPCTLSGSSQTIGMTIASSSVVTTGAGLAWHGTAYN
jgi:hypothetical protein